MEQEKGYYEVWIPDMGYSLEETRQIVYFDLYKSNFDSFSCFVGFHTTPFSTKFTVNNFQSLSYVIVRVGISYHRIHMSGN